MIAPSCNRSRILSIILERELVTTTPVALLSSLIRFSSSQDLSEGSLSELNRAILIELVQRVMVHEDGGIEVVLDCEDRYQEIIERAEKIISASEEERRVV